MDGSANPDQESLVDSFVGVTSATRPEAIFFLESHNWALDAAILSFYDNNSNPNSPAAAAPAAAVSGQGEQEQEEEEDEEDQGDEDYVPPVDLRRRSPPSPPQRVSGRSPGIMSSSSNTRNPARSSGNRPTIRTLADLNRRPSPGSDDDSDEPQEYYTGGEKSGMLVQDPTRGNHDVDAIFDRARRMGAMDGPFEPHAPSSSRSFIGTGRTLTGDTVQTAPHQPENIVHNIYFWSNGFSINDGPLRSFDDPENAAFLESIQKSECPKELAPADRGTAVHVNLMRREEKYPEPVKRQAAFQGVGRTLGGGSSSSNSQASESAAPMTAPTPSVGLFVDPALPTTSIQLRLADGTRMVAQFNHHHTIADIRAFIDASRSGAARNYQLQTVGFPPKQLTDLTQTIEQAGLANSVVIQKV